VLGAQKRHLAVRLLDSAPRQTCAQPPESSFVPRTSLLAPTRARRLCLLAVSLLVLGSGAPQAREAVSLSDPFEVSDSPAGNYLSARVAEAEHDSFAASTFARETLRADPNNLELIERAFVATLLNGDMPECFALAQKVVARDQKNGTARLALAVRDIRGRNFTGARKQLAGSSNLRQRDLTATLLEAWTHVGSGDLKRGLAMVDTLGESNLAVFRDFHAGLMLEVAGNLNEAGKRFAAAYAGDQNTLRLVDAYARNLSRQGKSEEAKAAYLAYLKVQPRQPMVKAALGDLEAGRKLDPMVRDVAGGAAEVLYGLGAYGLGSSGGRQGDEIAATVFLRLALALAPAHELALDTLGEAYSRLKQYRTAIDVYDETPDSSPLRTSADIHIALLLDAVGKPDEALSRLRKLAETHPDSPEAQSALADLLRNKKKFLDAADAYTRVLAVSPPNEKGLWAVYYFRGIAYERAKIWDKAEPDFKKALDLYPEQPLVLNYLGYSWVDQGVHLDEAFKMLRRAVELQPEDGYIVDSLGWAHYRLGHYDDAVKLLERAIELKPSDPTINDHLGDAYWQVGRKLDAQFQWNHARDLNPEPDELPKILAKIANGLTEPKQPLRAGRTPDEVKPRDD